MHDRIQQATSSFKSFGSACSEQAMRLWRHVRLWIYSISEWLFCTVFWQKYPKLYLSIVSFLIGIVVAFTWSVLELVHLFSDAESRYGDFFHPLTLLLALLGALLTGEYVSARFGDLRVGPPPVPLEEAEGQTTEPWTKTNHSFPKMRWAPDIELDYLKTIRDFYLKQEHGIFKHIWIIFEKLNEETGTNNYRVLPFIGYPRFIRVYKVPDLYDLRCRDRVMTHLEHLGHLENEKRVFDPEFFNFLKPIKIKDPDLVSCKEDQFLYKKTLHHSVFNPGGDVFIQMFPYSDVNMHFTGEKMEELKSVAAAIGRLQAALQLLDSQERPFFEKNPIENKSVRRRRTADDLRTDWEKLKNNIERRGNENLFSQILLKEIGKDIFEKWVTEVADLRENDGMKSTFNADSHPILIHDVHPHNVLCKDYKCVLIFDYTWIGSWPHSWVVAFSLHRFVREYLIEKNPEGIEEKFGREDRKRLKNSATEFLDSYRDGLTYFDDENQKVSLPLSDRFVSDLGKYIRCANMDKMLSLFCDGVGEKRDILMRPIERRLGEARKFVRFMKEAEEFVL